MPDLIYSWSFFVISSWIVFKSGKGNTGGFIMTCIYRVGGQILVLSGELQVPEGDWDLEKP